MKKYTYTGSRLAAFTIKGDGDKVADRDITIGRGTQVELPEDAEIVKDMVAKKLLVEVTEAPKKNKKGADKNAPEKTEP